MYSTIRELLAEAERRGVDPSTLLPPVTGGSDDDPPEPPEPAPVATFTQAQVNSMVADAKREARDAIKRADKAEEELAKLKDKRPGELAAAEQRGRQAVLNEQGELGTRLATAERELGQAQRDHAAAQSEVERLTTELEGWETDGTVEYEAAIAALPEDLRELAPDADEPLRKRRKWLLKAQAKAASRTAPEPPVDPPDDSPAPPRRPATPPDPRPAPRRTRVTADEERAALARNPAYRGRISSG